MKKSGVELFVGVFVIAGFLAFAYLAFNLGEVAFLKEGRTYSIVAEFDNVSGVKKGASVQVAGVVVGEVSKIWLGSDTYAKLQLTVNNDVTIPVDSMASVKSQGIIGDKYIQLSLGGDEEIMKEGEILRDTESSLDIESLISKFAFGSAK